MVVYKAAYSDSDMGVMLSWHPSKEAASKAIEAAKKEDRFEQAYQIEKHNIPATRAGLLKWLNTHFTTDNG